MKECHGALVTLKLKWGGICANLTAVVWNDKGDMHILTNYA